MRVQKPASLDHFVGEREQLVREGKADAPAVLRLVARSNLTGACTGRSPGFSPLKMAANHRLVQPARAAFRSAIGRYCEPGRSPRESDPDTMVGDVALVLGCIAAFFPTALYISVSFGWLLVRVT